MALYSRAQYEWDLEQCDAADAVITRSVAAGELDGLVALTLWKKVELHRMALKGRLLATRSMLQDNDKKPRCDDRKTHTQVCMCGNYNRFKASQQGMEE